MSCIMMLSKYKPPIINQFLPFAQGRQRSSSRRRSHLPGNDEHARQDVLQRHVHVESSRECRRDLQLARARGHEGMGRAILIKS